ncbi:hypothetical protein [Nocardia sp. NPDC005366]|uniref:hypothetical protein n=1 Tax=Nocardia sp. NPDC005366 TaxID=3156878 RepID=UPI0033BF2A46
MLQEQGTSGPPDIARDESIEATQARNRVREIVEAVDTVQFQDPQVPQSAFVDPDGMPDLYSRVQEMKPEDVGITHATWESIRNKLDRGLPNFKAEIEKAIADKWTGDAGSAAAKGITEYVAKSGDLLGSVQLIAEKVKIVRSAIDITKPAVQETPEHTWSSDVASWVPGPTWKLNQHREDQYHQANVNVVKNVFYPAVREADTQVPLVPKPYNPIHTSGDQPTPSQPVTDQPGQQPTSATRPPAADQATPGEGTNPGERVPGTADPAVTEQQSAADPTATDPSASTAPTTQAAAAPTSATDPNPNRTGDSPRANSATPGSGSPEISGTPGGSGSPTASAPGRGVAGTPGGAGSAASANSGARSSTGRPGASGASGIGGMSPRGKDEDDKERRTKDYLINQQNGEELTGLDEASRAKTVPPVIGE